MIEKNWAKDLITDEPDGIARYNIVTRDGTIAQHEVYLQIASLVMQNPTLFVASFLNTLLDRDSDTGELFPNGKTRPWGASGETIKTQIYHGGAQSQTNLNYGSLGIDDLGNLSVGDKDGKAVKLATLKDLKEAHVMEYPRHFIDTDQSFTMKAGVTYTIIGIGGGGMGGKVDGYPVTSESRIYIPPENAIARHGCGGNSGEIRAITVTPDQDQTVQITIGKGGYLKDTVVQNGTYTWKPTEAAPLQTSPRWQHTLTIIEGTETKFGTLLTCGGNIKGTNKGSADGFGGKGLQFGKGAENGSATIPRYPTSPGTFTLSSPEGRGGLGGDGAGGGGGAGNWGGQGADGAVLIFY